MLTILKEIQDTEVVESFLAYDWPGNVLELANNIEFMVNMMEADGLLSKKLLPRSIVSQLKLPAMNLLRSGYARSGRWRSMRSARPLTSMAAPPGGKGRRQKLGIGIACRRYCRPSA